MDAYIDSLQQTQMDTSLATKNDVSMITIVKNDHIIILLRMITKMQKKILLILSIFLLVCCTNKEVGIDPHTIIFLNVTNKIDTCMIGTFPNSLYYQLNIKCVSEKDFYDYIGETIEKKRALVLSDSYFLLCQEDSVTRSDIADSIYNECGLEGLEDYVTNSPLVIFTKADQEVFEWVAYILWENDIRVTIDDEDASWSVEK